MNTRNDKMTDNEFKTSLLVIGAVGVGLAVLPTLTIGLVIGAWFRSQ